MASSLQSALPDRASWIVRGKTLLDISKVVCVTAGSILAVIFASLVISIIQFQARLAEARVQNNSITFESIQLIADYQGYISKLYTTMRARSEELGPLRADYLDRVNATTQQIVSLCNALDPARYEECYTRITALINANNSQLDSVVSEFKSDKPDAKIEAFIRTSTDGLKSIVSSGQLVEVQKKYFSLQKLIQSECESLTVYVSDRLSNSSLLAISPELRSTISVQCHLGGLQGGPEAARAVQQTTGAATPAQDVRQPEQTRTETQGVNRLLLSELVFYYKFYDGLTARMGPWVRPLILAPPEFIIIILVLSTGILGSFLFHTYAMFSPRSAGVYPSFASIFLRATLGAMCALVLFILMRTGFVAVTEGRGQGAAAMSPFVIAFISVAAGLLADPTMERIKNAGLTAIRSGGQDSPEPRPARNQTDEKNGKRRDESRQAHTAGSPSGGKTDSVEGQP